MSEDEASKRARAVGSSRANGWGEGLDARASEHVGEGVGACEG